MPFTFVSENAEVILKSASARSVFEVGQESLWTQQTTWKVFMDENIIRKRSDISGVINGFPGGSSGVMNL